MKAGIIGSGAWGTVLAHLLATQKHSVTWWVREEDVCESVREEHENFLFFPDFSVNPDIEVTTDPSLLSSAEVFLFAVPSPFARTILRQFSGVLSSRVPFISATKGVEASPFKRISEVIEEEIPGLKIGVLSGPNLSREVARGDPSATVIASSHEEVLQLGQSLFAGSNLRVYTSQDVIGVEIGGSFKNIIAIASGMATGLGYGANTLGALLARGLAEMKRVGACLGALSETFSGLAGVGDLVTTCASPLSRNYTLGFRLAQQEPLEKILSHSPHIAEGVPTTKAYYTLALENNLDLPITREVYQILFEKKDPKSVVQSLMSRPLKPE